MQFSCTMCEASGEIPEDELAHPVTRTTCRNCGTLLLIDLAILFVILPPDVPL